MVLFYINAKMQNIQLNCGERIFFQGEINYITIIIIWKQLIFVNIICLNKYNGNIKNKDTYSASLFFLLFFFAKIKNLLNT